MIQGSWRSTDDITALRDELRRWEGAVARAHTLSASLPRLQLWLWRPGADVRLEIMCVAPHYYSGPLSWRDASIDVVPAGREHWRKHQVEYELHDLRTHVIVRCLTVQAWHEVAEHWQSQKD